MPEGLEAEIWRRASEPLIGRTIIDVVTDARVVEEGFAEAVVGATFDGHNRNGDHEWTTQGKVIEADPERFFRPPYVGHRGWIGMRLDVGALDWDEVFAVLVDAYRLVAPKTLVKQLDAELAGS